MEDALDTSPMAALETQLECQICLSLICEPITIPCGHSFCRTCLVQSLRKSKKQCVTCRSICNIDPVQASENIMLKNIALSINPHLYHNRMQEIAAEKLTWPTILPVFFYNVSMFPGEILSLHLFEPRYKLMMQRIATSSRKFAYVYVSPHRPLVGAIALIAHVRESEFFADGRCLVEAVLTAPRYEISDIYEESGTQGLYLAQLKPYFDLPLIPPVSTQIDTSTALPAPPVDLASVCAKLNNCRMMCSNGYENARAYDPLPPSPSLDMDPSALSNSIEFLTLSIMGRCPTNCPGEKAQFLRSQNTLERLEYCHHYLVGTNNEEMRGLGSLLRHSMGGILGWISGGENDGGENDGNENDRNQDDGNDNDGEREDLMNENENPQAEEEGN